MLTRRPIFTATQAAGTLLQERVTVRHDPSQNVTHTHNNNVTQRRTCFVCPDTRRCAVLCCATVRYAGTDKAPFWVGFCACVRVCMRTSIGMSACEVGWVSQLSSAQLSSDMVVHLRLWRGCFGRVRRVGIVAIDCAVKW